MSVQKFDVTVVAGIIQDMTCYTPRLPIPGETIIGSKFSLGFGGKGANQAFMATRLGARTAVVGKVGEDYFGHSAVQNLKENGVFCDHITQTRSSMTGVSSIIVTETGQNSIISVLGANLHLGVEDVRAAADLFKSTSVVLCQLEHKVEVVLEALKLAKESGVTIFNPAPAQRNVPKELLIYSDIVCPNEFEATAITGSSVESNEEVENAIQKLLELGAKTAVITLGERGCAFASQDTKNVSYIAARRVKAVDTTGAGDAFLGSLAFFTAKYGHLSMEERLRRSCALASLSVQYPGTMSSYMPRHDLPQDLFR